MSYAYHKIQIAQVGLTDNQNISDGSRIVNFSGTGYGNYPGWNSITGKWSLFGPTGVNIGQDAGKYSQQNNTIVIGTQAGYTGQATGAIAIGYQAGYTGQATGSIAIGWQAGSNTLGSNSIAIGTLSSAYTGVANSICLNASGNPMSGATGFCVNPVRANPTGGLSATGGSVALYNPATYEFTYQPLSNPVVSISGATGVAGVSYAYIGNVLIQWGLSFPITSGSPSVVTLAKPYTATNTYTITATPWNSVAGSTGAFSVFPNSTTTFTIDSEGFVGKTYYFQTIGY